MKPTNKLSWHYRIYASTFLIFLETIPGEAGWLTYWFRILIIAPIVWVIFVPVCGILVIIFFAAMWIARGWRRLARINWVD